MREAHQMILCDGGKVFLDFFLVVFFPFHHVESLKNDAKICEFHGWDNFEIARNLTQ